MSYDEKLLREFIRSSMGSISNKLNEELGTAITVADAGAPHKSIKLQTYEEKWGVPRADWRTHPVLNMLGLGQPVADLWDNFFGRRTARNPSGGWINPDWWTQNIRGAPGPVGGGVSELGDSVINGFTQGLPGHRGGAWQQGMGTVFPRSTGILAGPGNRALAFSPVREAVEEEETVIDFTDFSAALNNDLHELIRGVESVKNSSDAVTALERFNGIFGATPSLSSLRRDFENSTDSDINKQELLDLFTNDVVPEFVSHIMDTGVENMISNLDFTPRQSGEIENLLYQSKMRL